MELNSFEFNQFCQSYGKLIFFSQFIENDLRLLYCLKNTNNKDDFEKLYKQTKTEQEVQTFGKLLNSLKFDIKNDNYELLNNLYKVLEIRNYWVHENIIQYFYKGSDFMRSLKVNLDKDLSLLFNTFKILNKYKNEIKKKMDI